jgi:glycogen debranching enzyme/putative sterol carrier protein
MAGSISSLDGNCFIISDLLGDVDARPDEPQGLFFLDTRYLSTWKLTLNGSPLAALSTDETHYFAAQFFLVPPTGTVYKDPPLSVIRKRAVGDGFHEDVIVLNHGAEPVSLELRIAADADFADLFEVKDALVKKGELYRRVENGRLLLGYRREQFVRETLISATAPEVELDEGGLTFRLTVEPKGEWQTCIDVVGASNLALAESDDVGARRVKYGHGETAPRPNMGPSLDDWVASAPTLLTDWDALKPVYARSLIDLAALRFYSRVVPGEALPAAGLPWFMTMFGRDSVITSLQALPYLPELAESTLRVLAFRQGARVDDFRDEEPGKILHELRVGELTAFEERPHSPYYGTCDATPLYLVLLDETYRWTGNLELVQQLEPAARRALHWIDEYGDRDGDGFVEYERRNVESGLENQCWKDSWDSILFRDGSLATTPLATCEIQGYVYDAKVRCARLAREVWKDDALAEELEADAAELRRKFDDAFWMPDRGFYALALDGDKRQVDSLTSNPGHLLWSGIVDEDKAASVVDQLMGDAIFSGWGLRTMATTEGGYNPIRYHDGTVWPHDNSIAAFGLTRYGYRREAARIAAAMIEAASYFNSRLPEVFAGYPRDFTRYPVEYPTACSPQAWASGTPLALITAMLDLTPAPDGVASDPELPDGVSLIELVGVRAPRTRSSEPLDLSGVANPADFFARLAERSLIAGRQAQDGTLGIDLGEAGRWTVVVDGGKLRVEEGGAEADCTIQTSEETFMRILRGEQHPNTAVLSGKVAINGNVAFGQQLLRLVMSEVLT